MSFTCLFSLFGFCPPLASTLSSKHPSATNPTARLTRRSPNHQSHRRILNLVSAYANPTNKTWTDSDSTRTENILPASNAAPSLIAHQKELEKHMRADSLNDKLSHRPDPEELVREGVLKEDPRTADDKYAEAMEEEYAKREGGA